MNLHWIVTFNFWSSVSSWWIIEGFSIYKRRTYKRPKRHSRVLLLCKNTLDLNYICPKLHYNFFLFRVNYSEKLNFSPLCHPLSVTPKPIDYFRVSWGPWKVPFVSCSPIHLVFFLYYFLSSLTYKGLNNLPTDKFVNIILNSFTTQSFYRFKWTL